MGRPLNKKYFGNRNIGSTSTTADDGIGGEGIGSISWSNVGSFLPTGGTPLAGLALPAPMFPGGVQATWTVSYGAAAVTTGAGSVDLVVGETYEYAPIPGLLVTVATSSDDATNATFTVTTAGSTTTVLTDLQTVNLTKSAGMTGAETFAVDIYLKIVGIVINQAGSGYVGPYAISPTLANGAVGTPPAATVVLTADTGTTGTATNQENAIVMTADIGNGPETVDIIRQVSTRRYKVTNGTDTAIVKLVAALIEEPGQANIVATSSAALTEYYVTKLTAHKATLVAKTGPSPALNGQAVQWTFGSPSATIVKIANG